MPITRRVCKELVICIQISGPYIGLAIALEESALAFVIMMHSFRHPPCRYQRDVRATSMLVDSIYHNYPSPMMDCPDGSLELDLASTEAIDAMEATQERLNRVYPKALAPKQYHS